ncbi:MAG: response regulator [Syntrophaceae bacterium]|nr:response regulator [Syntrophaceae bacterium]
MTPRRILIVDNDPVMLALLGKFLTREGHEVRTAQDGAGALEILETWVPDVVFVDMVMPGMSGDRLCRLIRGDSRAGQTYLCVITALSEDELLDFRSFGANACIRKEPFHELSKNILAILHDEPLRDRPEILGFRDQPGQNIIRELIGVKEHLESLIASMAEGVLELDGAGRVLYANESALRILGLPEKEIVSRDFAGLAGPGNHAAVADALRAAGGGARQRISPLVLDNGREVALTALSVRNSKGPIVILDDMTDQRKAQEVLRRAASELEKRVEERTEALQRATRELEEELKRKQAAEKKLRENTTLLMTVLDGISDPVLMVDGDLTVQLANRAARDTWATADRQDLVGASCAELFGSRYDAEQVQKILAAARASAPCSFDLENRSESVKFERIAIDPIRYDPGEGGAVILRVADITKQKLMERDLVQREKLASLGLLVSGIAHELNNPNNFIVFNLPILREYLQEILPVMDREAEANPGREYFGMPYGDFREDLLKLLQNIENGSHRINATVSKLREFSRQKEKEREKKVPMPIGDLVRKAASICMSQIKKRVKTFEVDIPEDLPQIVLDTDSFEQVMINLLINAAHAADKPESLLRVSARSGNSWQDKLILEVADNGCGMDARTLGRIFEPFFTTKHDGTGTGLGLYVSKNLIEEMGGKIEVESQPGAGTVFRLHLADQQDAARPQA